MWGRANLARTTSRSNPAISGSSVRSRGVEREGSLDSGVSVSFLSFEIFSAFFRINVRVDGRIRTHTRTPNIGIIQASIGTKPAAGGGLVGVICFLCGRWALHPNTTMGGEPKRPRACILSNTGLTPYCSKFGSRPTQPSLSMQ